MRSGPAETQCCIELRYQTLPMEWRAGTLMIIRSTSEETVHWRSLLDMPSSKEQQTHDRKSIQGLEQLKCIELRWQVDSTHGMKSWNADGHSIDKWRNSTQKITSWHAIKRRTMDWNDHKSIRGVGQLKRTSHTSCRGSKHVRHWSSNLDQDLEFQFEYAKNEQLSLAVRLDTESAVILPANDLSGARFRT
jgi:hypothetical protein